MACEFAGLGLSLRAELARQSLETVFRHRFREESPGSGGQGAR
jgi:hypothetical protein